MTDRSAAVARDPYDRTRRSASKSQLPVGIDDEIVDSGSYGFDADDQYVPLPPVPRVDTSRSRRRPTQSTEVKPRAEKAPRQGPPTAGLLAFVPIQLQSVAGVLGVSLLSLLLMIIVLAIRIGSLEPWIPIHLNAEGTPDLWGTRSTLWRLPLMAGVFTVMSAAVCWFMAKRNAFASRFAMLSVLLIHALIWIALVHLIT